MDIKTFLDGLEPQQRREVAAACKTTYGHLRNVAYGLRACSEKIAALLEVASGGAVMRWESHPDDWRDIWPELADRPDAPMVEKAPA